jgi:hypothetical protein
MTADLTNITKYFDFILKMDPNRKRKTSYKIEVTKMEGITMLTVDPRLAKKLCLKNEVYLTPLKDKCYALVSNHMLCDDSIRLDFEKDVTVSTSKEAILDFLTAVNINTDELTSYTFRNIKMNLPYAMMPL